MNITLHRAINTTPYEAVFGITAHRENHQNTDEDIKCQGETTELASGKNTLDNDQCETFERAAKRQKIRGKWNNVRILKNYIRWEINTFLRENKRNYNPDVFLKYKTSEKVG